MKRVIEEIEKLATEAEEKCSQWMKCGDRELAFSETGKVIAYEKCLEILKKYAGE